MKYTLFTFLLVISFSNYAQNVYIKSEVIPETELLSIVFRLAETHEYVNNNIEVYAKKVDEHFSKFQDHGVIQLAQKLKFEQGVGYDAVMSLALHIRISEGVKLRNGVSVSAIDSRWGNYMYEFLDNLSNFVLATNFMEFFYENEALYNIATESMDSISKSIDYNWIDKMFGKQDLGKAKFKLIPNLLNGYCNYGLMRKSKTDTIKYAIIGCGNSDQNGNPVFYPNIIPIVIHELCHSFTNPIVNKVYNDIIYEAQKIFDVVKDKMSSQAYGEPNILIYEYLVRTCVLDYIKNNPQMRELSYYVMQEEVNGFYGIDELMNLIENGLQNINPDIITYFKNLSVNYESFHEDFNLSCSKIIYSNIKGEDIFIDPNTKHLEFEFNHAMNKRTMGFSNSSGGEMPIIGRIKRNKTKMKIRVKLQPNSQYSFIMPRIFFLTENGYPLDKDYYFKFKTGSK